jgi:hypothetical protein
VSLRCNLFSFPSTRFICWDGEWKGDLPGSVPKEDLGNEKTASLVLVLVLVVVLGRKDRTRRKQRGGERAQRRKAAFLRLRSGQAMPPQSKG